MHGIQAWVALPREDEETAPGFANYSGAALPTMEERGIWLRVVAGELYGMQAKAATHSPMFYAHVRLKQGATISLPTEYSERAAFVVSGSVTVDGRELWQRRKCWSSCQRSDALVLRQHGRDVDDSRRRAAGRAIHRMEFRFVIEGTNRAGEGRLARRTHEAAGL